MSKVPPMHANMHRWTLIGSFELKLGEGETRRIIEEPEDIAIGWRERGELVKVFGPGCEICGVHAKEGLGTPCKGADALEAVASRKALQDKIWTPPGS